MKYIRWNTFSNIVALTTTRKGGNSLVPYDSLNLALQVGDDLKRVLRNRKQLWDDLHFDQNQVVYMEQTHSIHIQKVSRADGGRGQTSFHDGIHDCDGLYTSDSNLALCILHADCVPLFFYIKDRGIIGVIHAGWLGTLKEATFHMLSKLFKDENITDVSEVYVFIGPNIQHHQIIDAEVQSKMMEYHTSLNYVLKDGQQTFINPEQMNIDQLHRLGITKIERCGHNNYEDQEHFFSFLRDQKVCGRHVSMIAKRD